MTIDSNAAATLTNYTTTTPGATATPASVPYGTAVVLGTTGLPSGATGTVTYTSGGSTLSSFVIGSGSTCRPRPPRCQGPPPVHGSPPPFQPPGIPVNLPFTGFNAERLLLVTAFMVATGTILVATSRRSVTGRLFGHRQ